jgi:hypothetical protein
VRGVMSGIGHSFTNLTTFAATQRWAMTICCHGKNMTWGSSVRVVKISTGLTGVVIRIIRGDLLTEI